MSHLMELRAVWGSRPLFSVGVSVLLQDESGRVLLQKRGDDGLWGVVGGALEPGEDFLTAAHRELREETGLSCPSLHLLPLHEGLIGGREFYHRYPNGHEVYLVGRRAYGTLPADALNDAVPDDSGETLDLQWFPLDALPPLSSNINLCSMNLLRTRVELLPLPLEDMPTPPASGNYLRALRAVMGQRPIFAPGANILVTNERERLLLLRLASTGRWTLPGGNLELGESFEEGAGRSLHAATGLHAEQLRPVLMYAGPEYRLTSPHGGVIDAVRVLYRAEGVSGNLRLQVGEILDARWFVPAEWPAEVELSGRLIAEMVQWWRKGGEWNSTN